MNLQGTEGETLGILKGWRNLEVPRDHLERNPFMDFGKEIKVYPMGSLQAPQLISGGTSRSLALPCLMLDFPDRPGRLEPIIRLIKSLQHY